GNERIAVALDALPSAESSSEGLAERDPGVLCQVVDVDVEVAFALDRHGEPAVADQLVEQEVEEPVPRSGRAARLRIEVERHLQPRLARATLHVGSATHGVTGRSMSCAARKASFS